MDSACLFFVEAKSSPTINGTKNNITKPSNLSWVANDAKPLQNSFEMNGSIGAPPGRVFSLLDTTDPITIMAIIEEAMIIFLVFEIEERKRK